MPFVAGAVFDVAAGQGVGGQEVLAIGNRLVAAGNDATHQSGVLRHINLKTAVACPLARLFRDAGVLAVDLAVAVVAADRAGAVAQGRDAQAYLHAHAAVACGVVADVLQAFDKKVAAHRRHDPVGAGLRAAQDRVAAGVHGQVAAGLDMGVVPLRIPAIAFVLAAACRQVDADAVLGSTDRKANPDTGVAALAVSLLAGGTLLGGLNQVAASLLLCGAQLGNIPV